MRALACLLVLAGAACWSGCGAARPDPRRVSPDDAIITIQCEVADAEVWVDGRFVAPVSGVRGGIALTPGAHRIEIRSERHHSVYLELDLARRERRAIPVELAEILE